MPKPFLAESHEGYSVRADTETGSAELVLYGRVVKTRPYDYEQRKPTEENFIVEHEILADLKKISKCKRLEIRLNSCGGECNTGIVIHNKLRELAKSGMEITCIVDGVAMSAGSHIMCAADCVKASEGSLIMIHKSMLLAIGYYNADNLRKMALASDAYDKALVAAYKRKTGKSEEDLLKMMSDETYMTGTEAKEQGFVDEIIETDNKIEIAASADKSALIVGGHFINLDGAACPDNIPISATPDITALSPAASGKHEGEGDANTPKTNKGGNTTMADNLAELRKENPTLASAIEAEIKSQCAEENKTATEIAVQQALGAERKRLEKIEAIAGQVSPGLLADAKYNNPCTAEELAYKAMAANAKKGEAFLISIDSDYSDSGVAGVKAVAPAEDKSEAEQMEEARTFIADTLKEEDE